MYRLIVSDLDGTLLNNKHHVSDYTKDVIKNAVSSGVDFMLASGRIYGAARIFAKELSLNTPILACNGAIIKEYDGELVYGKAISNEVLEKLFDFLIKSDYYFHFYGEECFYSHDLSVSLNSFYAFQAKLPEEDRFPMYQVKPGEILGKDSIYKIMVICEDDTARKKLYNQLIKIHGISVTSSWFNSFDICAHNVSKSSAIEKYAKKNNILPSEIICFGDNHNDMDMIKYAGFGVAMENGVSQLKEAADYITGTNDEDGVAKAIEKFILL